MAVGFVGAIFSRMFMCGPAAPPVTKNDGDDNTDFVSEVSGTEDVSENKPLVKNSVKASKISGKRENNNSSNNSSKSKNREIENNKESKKHKSQEKGIEKIRKRGKSSCEKKEREKTRMQINNESESEENKESDRKRRKSKKLKDFVGKVNNKKKKRGISEASEEIVDILSQKEDDDEIVKGLENLLRNPPTRNGDYSSRVEARENSFGKDKDRRRSSHSKTELDIKKDSSTEEEKDDGENYTRNEVKMVHNREQTLLNSGRNSERRSNSIASTESLRNSSFRYKFCNTANSVDSEATTETLMADEYSSTHSSDNETEVSYMIDFYDKIHFNKILVKKMTKFLNRRRKM